MNFRKSAYLLALGVSLMALPSCKKYLDYQSPSKLNTEQTFEDVNYTNSAVIGIYTRLCGSNAYGNQLSVYFHLGTDEFVYRGSTSFDGGADYAIPNYGAIPTHSGMYNAFVQLYSGIERANIACKFIPSSNLYKNGTADQQKQMRRYYGEALSLRAQFYYELIRNWGDVPATFVPAADLSSQFLAHSNRDSTYDRILDDLKMAAELLPWRDEQSDYGSYRWTKAAAKALRARIALARGGYSLRTDTKLMERRADYQKYYQIAFEECNDIIKSKKHGLNPVYENIFKSLHSGTARFDNTYELLFEVAMWGQINDSNVGSANGLTFSSSPSWGGAGGRSTAVPTYFYEFENGKDVRRDVTLATYKVQADPTGAINQKILVSSINFNINKFRKSWTAFDGKVTGTYGVNWPIIRYADVLLMYAEAANELGTAGEISALDALQQVQKRAYGANALPATPTDKDGFFKAIVKERLLEFGGEGVRKYDLIRWNLLAEKIAETKTKMGLFATGAPADNNPYANLPQYIYATANNFLNTDLKTEAAGLSVYGGVPDSVFFKPMTVTTNPSGYPSRLWWRQETGTWTNGVLTSSFINDPNNGYVSKFVANKKELLPYPERVIIENRGGIVQNFGYTN
ncbi:RagB/SusD family nutrient uptake outer membrane protein [Paraflavisolibacter sp. H34]|uniref:RagB/SusD family nutrient uptake outer membrane protein n=1 Tax=Huijunlia imazamoxiresistens TaxID=3127457 RepID=UPI0030192037